jgi:hypothetical protein
MMHKVFLAATAAVVLFVSAGASHAFPIAPIDMVRPANATKVTFWGQPFPYGYRWSLARACMRYETIETSRGRVTQRVWVCGRHREAVVSYRG